MTMSKLLRTGIVALVATTSSVVLSLGIAQAKDVVITTDKGWPPATFLNEQEKLEGYLYEIEVAAAKQAGWNAKFEYPSFEAVIPGLLSGKYDLGGNVDVNEERLKTLDIVSVLSIGYTLITRTDDGVTIADDMNDLCGRHLGIVASQVTLPAIEEQSKKCEAAGKEPVTVSTFPDTASSQLAVLSKRVDATTITTSQSGWFVKNAPKWRVTGPIFGRTTAGIAVKKGNPLGQEMADAINALIADGTYGSILSKWEATSAGIEKSEVVKGQ